MTPHIAREERSGRAILLVSLTIALTALSVVHARADDDDPEILGISLSSVETSAGKAALGGAFKLLPSKQIDLFTIFGQKFGLSEYPLVDVSGAGGDAFAHIRAQEVLTRDAGPGEFNFFAQTYVGYDADTDLNDASIFWGVAVLPVFRLGNSGDGFGNRLFAHDANSAGLYFELGSKLSDPSSTATGGKIDQSGDVAGDPIYRLKATFNCVVGLYPNPLEDSCDVDPDVHDAKYVADNPLQLFFRVRANAYYNIRPGLFAPEVVGEFGYRFKDRYFTTLYLGVQYGSGAPTFNRDTQFKFSLTTDFFKAKNLLGLVGVHCDDSDGDDG